MIMFKFSLGYLATNEIFYLNSSHNQCEWKIQPFLLIQMIINLVFEIVQTNVIDNF
jgi:hypothetical protein